MREEFEPTPPENGGEPLTTEQAIKNLQGDDTGLRYYAAWWLGRFRVSEPAAIEALLAALEDESDRTEDGGYPLRRNAARALGKLGNHCAVPALIGCLESSDYYLREAAAQALEMLGNQSCIPALMGLLSGGVEAAVQVPGKPHLAEPYDAVLEALGTLDAKEAIDLIKPFVEHPVKRVQYAAARAMYQLTKDVSYGNRLVEALQGKELQLRRSALMDLGAIGYLPAAEAIAETFAENSIKIMALKGILENTLETEETELPKLSDEAIRVMSLMDSLL
ncbi:HEAT repeat domain-containing protein [Ancylothrix sp. C2]|uniref:HEAT repeat domain-containing protein n=1 Tax=Ancylothrix sp. D3o TaxID=2953691 RepID=UPI0021BAB014|nr:HEAT repeat domain-containing protein [Ancylothrix sp. D3o]MCT7948760.1 HEAT repeat domain-containing protein [Ancylothrix sp. D3o]